MLQCIVCEDWFHEQVRFCCTSEACRTIVVSHVTKSFSTCMHVLRSTRVAACIEFVVNCMLGVQDKYFHEEVTW